MTEYAKPDTLVTTEWLAEHLQDPEVRILDVDEDTEAYAKGHIPGAVGVHWRKDLQSQLQRDFVGPEEFAVLLDRFGITPETHVVLYGGNKNWFAAYAYWYFKYYGHERVQLLNGGRKKWESEGRPLVTDTPETIATSGYPVPRGNDKIRAYRDQVASDVVGKTGKGLVDVRSPEEYRGESLAPAHLPQEGAQRGGHIPGARNIPWGKAVDPEQETFLSAEQLSQLYQGEGITSDQEIIAYCRIGERSAHTWFVLHELLGYPNVRNYDGSWTEWGSLVKAPIEK
ncbi:MAG TPA: sulfurtransferase [Candidatus Dormibacteraeota bacterium]|nr:sulfurtransferase [Candidatus Dormibacteraeota bacterium]